MLWVISSAANLVGLVTSCKNRKPATHSQFMCTSTVHSYDIFRKKKPEIIVRIVIQDQSDGAPKDRNAMQLQSSLLRSQYDF